MGILCLVTTNNLVDLEPRLQAPDISTIVALEPEGRRALERKGIHFRTSRDYATTSNLLKLDDGARNLNARWQEQLGEASPLFLQNPSFPGLDLTRVAEWELWYFFIGATRTMATLHAIVEKERPKSMLVVAEPPTAPSSIVLGDRESLWLTAATTLGESYGIKVEHIMRPPRRPAAKGLTISSLKAQTKRLLVATAALARGRPQVLEAGHRVAFVRVTPDLRVVAQRLVDSLNCTIWCLQPEAIGGTVEDRIVLWCPKDFASPEVATRVSSEAAHLRELGHRLLDNPSFQKQFQFEGMDLWPLVVGRLQYFFDTAVPRVLNLAGAARVFLERFRPVSVVAGQDAAEFDRTVIQTANSLGIPTLLVQHGITAVPIGFVPLTANRIAVWGEASKRWLMDHGVEPERILVTGAARQSRQAEHGRRRNPKHLASNKT